MNATIKIFTLGGLMMLLISGCNKFLDVQPEDKYTEEQVFSNEASAQQALNGLYMKMATTDLYGANLSTTLIELMGQRYTADVTSAYERVVKLNYTDAVVAPYFETVWQQAYATILKSNKFIASVDNAVTAKVITAAEAKILKGEAIAIRAMLHFDMLRIFGPVYTTGAALESIPYYTQPDGVLQPLLKTSVVVDTIIHDLSEAASLLAEDNIIKGGLDTAGTDFYTKDRQFRFNYYGVKALLARVYLYGNRRTDAYNTAREILTDINKWFPWMPYTSILSAGNNPDRIFSPEVIVGLENRSMYTTYSSSFAPTLTLGLLAPLDARLTATFENNVNDYRYTTTWLMGPKGFRTLYKYADLPDVNKRWRFMQPLLRKSELYYILAETEPDQTKALEYLNTVRFNRGLPNLTSTSGLATQIQNEYLKEFFGEGQIFFFYKRKNPFSIPNALTATSSIFSPNFRVPLPASETSLR